MFVTIGNIAQYVGDDAATILLCGGARKSSPMEAGNCVDRLIINGDPRMHDAEAEFKRTFSKSGTANGL